MFGFSIMITIIISSLLCAALSLVVALHYLVAASVSKTIEAMDSATGKISSLPPCDMDSLNNINEIIQTDFTAVNCKLTETWQWYYTDIKLLYSCAAAPSPHSYFSFDILTDNLKIKWNYWQASVLIIFLSFSSLFVSITISLFTHEDYMLGTNVAVSLLSIIVCLLFFLMITLIHRSRLHNLKQSFSSFVTTIASRLVFAGALGNSTATHSGRESAASYNESIAILTEKMDSFVFDRVAPAITDSFNETITSYFGPAFNRLSYNVSDSLRKLMISYELSLKEMSNGFFDKLLSGGGKAIDNLTSQITEVTSALTAAGNSYAAMLNASNDIMRQNLDACEKAYQAVIAVSDINQETLSYLRDSSSHTAGISDCVNSLVKTTQESSALMTDINRLNGELTSSVSTQFAELSENMAIFIERLDNGISQTSGTLTDISGELREAMKNLSSDVANSIQNAYKDNEKHITALTDRTEKLVSEYDSYFQDINKSTTNIITDMDFTVTNTLNRLSDEILVIIQKFNESISSSAERYETSSNELVTAFTTQTRDMGLYAHEINLDITTLSNNLKESVAIFNEKMNDGIGLTFTEFDKGAAEFTKRMSNTIEAIREAVDDLPKIISAQTKE